MAQFYDDTFTGTGGVNDKIELDAHTSDSGHSYVRSHTGVEIDTIIDKLVAAAAGNARQFWRPVVTPPSADYKVSMDVTVEALVDFTLCGPGARVTGTSDTPNTWNGYFAIIDPDLDQLQIVKYVNGVETALDTPGTPYTIGLGTPPETYKVTIEPNGTSIKAYLNDVERISDAVDSTFTAAGNPGGIIRVNTNYGHFSADNASAETLTAGGPVLDPVPTTAFPGQTLTLTGTNLTGTTGVDIEGEAQSSVTVVSDAEVTCTVVLGNNSYGANKTITLTTAEGTDNDLIELVADTVGGFGQVTMASPNTTDESSVCFGATPTVVTGDQFEWEDFNALGNLVIDAQGFVSSVDTEGVFRGRFWDATDSTWGTVENFTAEVPGGNPVGSGLKSLLKSLFKSNIKNKLRK